MGCYFHPSRLVYRCTTIAAIAVEAMKLANRKQDFKLPAFIPNQIFAPGCQISAETASWEGGRSVLKSIYVYKVWIVWIVSIAIDSRSQWISQ